MDKKTMLWTIIALILTALIVYLGSNPTTVPAKILGFDQTGANPRQLYRVYLGGESIGFIESKEELEDFIDEKQQELKEKYNVNKVYIPNDLDIVQEITYKEDISTIEEIYNEIKERKGSESFTIDGYEITINGIEKETEDGGTYVTDNVTIYVLDKEVFTDSVEKTIKSFIDAEDYENFLNDTQEEIKETGTIIEDLYIKNNITIKQDRIPTGETIYQTVEELSKFLLFGTTQDQQTYTVKEGDTIEDISFNNKLSPEEFLIANTEFSSAEDLLYPGKTVVLGVIQPQFDTVEETHVVSKRVKTRETIYVNDDTQYTGYEKVKQEGSDGLNLVTEKVQLVNGEIVSTVPVSSEVITSPVDKIIVRGTRKYVTPSAGSGYAVEVPVGIGSWVWPTNTPSVVTSEYGWRWGKLHAGMDISGTGYGSPIKAVNNGVVVVSSYTNINGHYIIIKHANGYFTEYAHMARRYVQKGAIVYANDVIGTMGQSGYAFGTHLHFGVWTGAPYTGTSLNPRSLYR